MRYVGLSLFLVMALASTAPAFGQGAVQPVEDHPLSIAVGAPPAPIAPVTGGASVPIVMTIGCHGLEDHTHPHQAVVNVTSDKEWVSVHARPTTVFFSFAPEACAQGGEVEVQTLIEVRLGHTAPAHGKATVAVRLVMDSDESVETTFPVQADVYGKMKVWFEATEFTAPTDSRLQVPLTVENHGNGPIKLLFARDDATSDALVVALPGPQHVASAMDGIGSRSTFNIGVRTPSENHLDSRLAIEVVASDLSDGRPLGSQVITTVIRTDGNMLLGELPSLGFGTVLMLAALALVRRRP